jgi:hypothetical protein
MRIAVHSRSSISSFLAFESLAFVAYLSVTRLPDLGLVCDFRELLTVR